MKFLFLVAASLRAQSVDSSSILQQLCSNTNSSNAICSYCKTNSEQCQETLPIATKLCQTEFKDSPICAPLISQCQTTNCTASSLPNSQQVSAYIYLICNEMPMMADCETCPPPSLINLTCRSSTRYI